MGVPGQESDTRLPMFLEPSVFLAKGADLCASTSHKITSSPRLLGGEPSPSLSATLLSGRMGWDEPEGKEDIRDLRCPWASEGPTTENESVWGGAGVLGKLDRGLKSHPGSLGVQGSRGRQRASLAGCVPNPGTATLVRNEGTPSRRANPANDHCWLQRPATRGLPGRRMVDTSTRNTSAFHNRHGGLAAEAQSPG